MTLDSFGDDFGKSVEDSVRLLCEKSFLSDFTIQSPKYRKAAGPHKEAADILVFFEGTLLAIQVKAKKISEEPSQIELNRFLRTISKAQDQFRALLEAFSDEGFGVLTNARGEEFVLDRSAIKNVILIVIFATVGASGRHTDLDLRPMQNCVPSEPIPSFTFKLRQFESLLTLADTLPDFLLYLDCHFVLSSHKLIPDATDPIDVWAFMTFERAKFIQHLDSKKSISFSGLYESHSASLQHMEEEEKHGYFIDWFIEELYRGIGFQLPINDQVAQVAESLNLSGTIQGYRQLIPHFAKLNRISRAKLAQELTIRIERCVAESRLSYGGMKFETHDEAYLVMASPLTQSETQIPLINAAHMLAYKLEVRRIICISTSLIEGGLQGSVALMFEKKSGDVKSEIKEAYSEFFSEPKQWNG